MKKLHPTQQKLLEILKTLEGEPFTIRELQSELDLSSPSLVHFHIQQLEKKGFIKRNPANPADYQIITDNENEICYLNLYGMAKCGPNGTILDGDPLDRLPLSPKLLSFPPEEAFLLKARGDSMEPKIPAGSIVIVRRTSQPSEGAIVTCSYQGEAFIKQLRRQGRSIRLHSLNPEYEDIEVTDDSLRIEGVVSGVLAYMGDF